MLAPGDTIGILGGGQLGRMMAIEAARLGLRTHIYCPGAESVAGDVAGKVTFAPWEDARALADFAAHCDVVTWEFENVPVGAIRPLGDKLAPGPAALEHAQDRLAEKRFCERLGGVPAPYRAVDDAQDLAAAVSDVGIPGILKTRRDGYDGKGQWRIAAPGDAARVELPGKPLIYEGFVTFEAEFSVILVRGRDGDMRFWDSTHNVHRAGILHQSLFPAPAIVRDQVAAARELAAAAAAALDYVGVLTCEFFATEAGPVFNEMAPRVHNSGHWTIEGAATSQFANHIRAVAGLPLGDTATTAARVTMTNLLGDDAGNAYAQLSQEGAAVHLYGKRESREGRKMGHVTEVERI